jgi:hypothetical protein
MLERHFRDAPAALTPRHLLGRLGGVYQMLALGLMPLGAVLAGPLAMATSLGAVLVGSGLLVVLVLLLVARRYFALTFPGRI